MQSFEMDVRGGGVTGVLDTATFELFRSACNSFYGEFPPTEGTCTIDSYDDKKKKTVVQHMYRIKGIENDTQIGYTINLYPTNNRLLVNGKDVDRFMDSHLPLLHKIMLNALTDGGFCGIDTMNRVLAEQLHAVLVHRRGGDSSSSFVQVASGSSVPATTPIATVTVPMQDN